MRCTACNRVLSNRESTRRSVSDSSFLDMCDGCYGPIRESVPTYVSPLFADEEALAEEADSEDSPDDNV